jgi:hypothetical protein
LRLLAEFPESRVIWVVFSSNPVRRREALQGARLFLKHGAKKNVVIRSYRDGFFPYQGARIKKEFEKLKGAVEPDLIFTHSQNDFHQDHRTVNELTWNTFRDHPVLEYEIPKYDGDLGRPNFFVPLEQEIFSPSTPSAGLSRRHFFPLCGCAEWNVMLQAVTPRPFIVASWCCKLKR